MKLNIEVRVTTDPAYWGSDFNEEMSIMAVGLQVKAMSKWIKSKWPKSKIDVAAHFEDNRIRVSGADKEISRTVAHEVYAQLENTWLEPANLAIIKCTLKVEH